MTAPLRLMPPIEMPYEWFVVIYYKLVGGNTWRRSAHTAHTHRDWSFEDQCRITENKVSVFFRDDVMWLVWYGQVSPPLFLTELPFEVSDEP